MSPEETVRLVVGLIAIATASIGVWRWSRPRIKARRLERESIATVLLGRDEIPANPITGAPSQPALPSIGQQVAGLRTLVDDIHHELHPNGGGSMKDSQARTEAAVDRLLDEVALMKRRLESGDRRFDDVDARLGRMETSLGDELHTAHEVAATATDAVAHAAEASKVALDTIQTAIKADPPADE